MSLVAAIKRGNEKAFVEAYDLFHIKLFHYFFKRTGLRETARELTQQAFIKLWQSRHTLSEMYDVDVQCFTIANSVLVDHLRKQAVERKLKMRVSDEQESGELLNAPAGNDFESADYLDKAARDLSPVRKNVFLLKITKGYSNKEIAEQLSISVKTVEDHYSKAIRHIRSVQLILLPAFLAGIFPCLC